MRKHISGLLLIVLLAIGAGLLPAAQVRDPERLKAAYVLAISRYTEWPAEAFSGPKSPVVIAFLGDSKFEPRLLEMAKGKTSRGRPLQVREIDSVAQSSGAHILIIGQDKHDEIKEILAALQGTPILTFCESEDFLQAGGAIQFLRPRPFVAFGVNLDATKAARLKIGSKVMDIARMTLRNGRIKSR